MTNKQLLGWVLFGVVACISMAGAAAAATEERLPHYITPSGPTKVIKPGTVACLAYEDLVAVRANDYGVPADIKGMIQDRRCVALPVGTMVKVAQRMPKPNGGETNAVCVQPAFGTRHPNLCVWLLIQYLDVRAD